MQTLFAGLGGIRLAFGAFSIIGSKLGFSDTRGTLFFEIERIITVKRPSAILLVSHDKGRTIQVILCKASRVVLAEIKSAAKAAVGRTTF